MNWLVGSAVAPVSDKSPLVESPLVNKSQEKSEKDMVLMRRAEGPVFPLPVPKSDSKASGAASVQIDGVWPAWGPSKQEPVLRGPRGARAGVTKKPIKVHLATVNSTNSSAAGAALAFNYALQCSSFVDFSSYAALYDEVKIVRANVYWNLAYPTPQPAATTGLMAVCVYDPADTVALTGIGNALTLEQHSGPMFVTIPSVLAPSPCAPTPLTRTGMWKFGVRVPKGSFRSNTDTKIFNGEWASTQDATDYFGTVKWYVTAGGGTQVSVITFCITAECLFRCRQ